MSAILTTLTSTLSIYGYSLVDSLRPTNTVYSYQKKVLTIKQKKQLDFINKLLVAAENEASDPDWKSFEEELANNRLLFGI